MGLNKYDIYGVVSPASSDTLCLNCAEKRKAIRYLSDREARSEHIQKLVKAEKIYRLSGHVIGGRDGWFTWKDKDARLITSWSATSLDGEYCGGCESYFVEPAIETCKECEEECSGEEAIRDLWNNDRLCKKCRQED